MGHKKSIGLPGGPNEYITDISEFVSIEGYSNYSKDINNPVNIIESGSITMKDVDFPVLGTDNLGNSEMMTPGYNYQFPGDTVYEIPMAQTGDELPAHLEEKDLTSINELNKEKINSATYRERLRKEYSNAHGVELSEVELDEMVSKLNVQLTKGANDGNTGFYTQNVPDGNAAGFMFSGAGQIDADGNQVNPRTSGYDWNNATTGNIYIARNVSQKDPYATGTSLEESVSQHEVNHRLNSLDGSPLSSSDTSPLYDESKIYHNSFFDNAPSGSTFNPDFTSVGTPGESTTIDGVEYTTTEALTPEEIKERTEFQQYATQPFEIKSQKAQLEQALQNAGIWNPSDGEFTQDHVDALKTSGIEFGKGFDYLTKGLGINELLDNTVPKPGELVNGMTSYTPYVNSQFDRFLGESGVKDMSYYGKEEDMRSVNPTTYENLNRSVYDNRGSKKWNDWADKHQLISNDYSEARSDYSSIKKYIDKGDDSSSLDAIALEEFGFTPNGNGYYTEEQDVQIEGLLEKYKTIYDTKTTLREESEDLRPQEEGLFGSHGWLKDFKGNMNKKKAIKKFNKAYGTDYNSWDEMKNQGWRDAENSRDVADYKTKNNVVDNENGTPDYTHIRGTFRREIDRINNLMSEHGGNENIKDWKEQGTQYSFSPGYIPNRLDFNKQNAESYLKDPTFMPRNEFADKSGWEFQNPNGKADWEENQRNYKTSVDNGIWQNDLYTQAIMNLPKSQRDAYVAYYNNPNTSDKLTTREELQDYKAQMIMMNEGLGSIKNFYKDKKKSTQKYIDEKNRQFIIDADLKKADDIKTNTDLNNKIAPNLIKFMNEVAMDDELMPSNLAKFGGDLQGNQNQMETASIHSIENKDGAYEDQSWFTKANHAFSENMYNNAQRTNQGQAPVIGAVGNIVDAKSIYDFGEKAYEGISNWISEGSNNKITGQPEGVVPMNVGQYGIELPKAQDGYVTDYKNNPNVYDNAKYTKEEWADIMREHGTKKDGMVWSNEAPYAYKNEAGKNIYGSWVKDEKGTKESEWEDEYGDPVYGTWVDGVEGMQKPRKQTHEDMAQDISGKIFAESYGLTFKSKEEGSDAEGSYTKYTYGNDGNTSDYYVEIRGDKAPDLKEPARKKYTPTSLPMKNVEFLPINTELGLMTSLPYELKDSEYFTIEQVGIGTNTYPKGDDGLALIRLKNPSGSVVFEGSQAEYLEKYGDVLERGTKEYGQDDLKHRLYPNLKYGGSLPKAQDGWWSDFEKTRAGKFTGAKGLRQDGEHIMATIGDYFGYEADEGKDFALDAAATLNPIPDFLHAGTKLEEGEYTDAALYAGFGILPFTAGPLVKGVKNKIINPIKNAFKSTPAPRGTTLNKYKQIKTSFDDLLDAPQKYSESSKFNSNGLLNVPNSSVPTRHGKLPLRNGQLDISVTGEGTQDFMVQVNKIGDTESGMQMMTRLDVPNAYYIDMSMTNPMDAGQTMKYLTEFMPKGSTISSKTSLSLDSYKLMLNRVKRGDFSVVDNISSRSYTPNSRMDLNMLSKDASRISTNSGGWMSKTDAEATIKKINKMLDDAGVKTSKGAAANRMTPHVRGESAASLNYKVTMPNLTLKMEYKQGGEVSLPKAQDGLGWDAGSLFPRQEGYNVKSTLGPVGNYIEETNEYKAPETWQETIDFINLDGLKDGISQAESVGGVLMLNEQSTATGLYGQRFSEIKKGKLYDGTREEFSKDLDAQNKLFESRLKEGLKSNKTTPLLRDAWDLTNEYAPQIEDFNYSYEDIIGLSNFLGRKGTRRFFGDVIRDGKSLEEAIPNMYGSGRAKDKNGNPVENKTPQEYLKIIRQFYKKEGGEYNVFQDYIMGKYSNTDKEKYAEGIYDKLNRVHYREAKEAGMSPANYIMTNLMGDS
jgi:hypothetical protein